MTIATEVSTQQAEQTDDAAFVAWMNARQPALLRTAYLLCGDAHTAEDLVSIALAKVYLRWGRLHSPDLVDAYARRIVVNENISLWRRPWRRRERPADVLPEAVHQPTGPEERDAMWRLLGDLPVRQRAVVVLRYYESLTEAETAAVLGVSVGTVKSQHHKAINHLRAALGADLGHGKESW